MYFPLSIAAGAVKQCLLKLSPGETERIYRLNNYFGCSGTSAMVGGECPGESATGQKRKYDSLLSRQLESLTICI
jgi:hypothetical protein